MSDEHYTYIEIVLRGVMLCFLERFLQYVCAGHNGLESGKVFASITAATSHIENFHAIPVRNEVLEIVKANRIGFE